ncbi:hypothetical protein AAGF08_14990 [Algoriphagus sp. SE2]|uniref:hypothetical protein n=1 Tax=Algoriphagus sp. SE2 TaxID=3141536 RepID=UPI0031CD184F
MPDNSFENKQWSDPKDYGLPYVEIVPLDSVNPKEPASEKELQKEESIVSKPVEQKKEVDSTLESKTDNPSPKEKGFGSTKALEKEEKQISSTSLKESIDTPEKNKSTWIPIVLISAIVVISVIVWQLLSQGNESPPIENQLVQQEEPVGEETSVPPTVENIETEETQSAENQDSISNSNSSLEEPVETSQTGTTIDRTGIETLIRVEGKSDRPQYFIVVGSLPNERMAIDESEQYLDRVSSIYMILPYEDVRNYRLAIGSFTSFRKASEELEAIKDQYTEALWILKY